MKSSPGKYISLIFSILITAWALSCSGRSSVNTADTSSAVADEVTEEVTEEADIRLIRLNSPDENSKFKSGDPVKVNLTTVNLAPLPDSVMLYYDGKVAATLRAGPWETDIPSSFTTNTGSKAIKAVAYRGGKARTTVTRFIIILSDIKPGRFNYKIINAYPHDKTAFTQGLFYDNGLLYEGTGQETGSTLREVELETGKVIRQLNLNPELFGEGITLYKDRIYQVTWRSKIGFVYDKASFNQVNRVYYQTEGWGLTTMDKHIVMSDGSNILYIIEPEMFTVITRLEVYDNEKMIDQLNELEYINGEIWANIWNTDLIARIDPLTGKLLAYVDLKGILRDPGTDTTVDVLNGIAFDRDGGRIFITGKNWPKLFEIRVIE